MRLKLNANRQRDRDRDRDRDRPGGTEGRTETHKFVRPPLATEQPSRARSFARTHARNASATETEIDFPVRGWDKSASHTPNLRHSIPKSSSELQ